MLQEFVPALKGGQKPKILSAESVLIEGLPGIDSKISFLPFINYSKDKQAVVSDIQSGFYNYLIKKFETEPDLLSPVENIQLLEENTDLLELLSTSLFPIVSEYE